MSLYAPAMHDQMQQAFPHKTRRHHPWLIALGILILAIAGLAILGAAQTPSNSTCTSVKCTAPPPRPVCTASSCAVPPARTQAIAPLPHYTSSAYGFSLYYSTANIDPSSTDDHSISWDATYHGSDVNWTFIGTNPNGRDARQIVEDAQSNNFGDASYAYTLPSPTLGDTPGYGNVYDLSVAPNGGEAVHERLFIIAAVKHNVAVVFIAMGPYQQTTPQSDDHPNPADSPIVDLGDVAITVQSVTWPGDPPL